jgi:hypothetical protein
LHKLGVLPCVDKRAVGRLLVGKYVLEPLDEVTAARCRYCREYRGNAEDFRAFGERDDVADDKLRVVAVKVRELKWLMIDKNKDTLLRV